MTTDGRTRCADCGDVIGIYEPLIALTAGITRETSLAAESLREDRDTSCFHRKCYELHDRGWEDRLPV